VIVCFFFNLARTILLREKSCFRKIKVHEPQFIAKKLKAPEKNKKRTIYFGE